MISITPNPAFTLFGEIKFSVFDKSIPLTSGYFCIFRVYQALQQTILIVWLAPSIRCRWKEPWADQFEFF